jgi:hypothetical protein
MTFQESLQVAGGTDGNTVLKNCVAQCTSYSANARTSNHIGESVLGWELR